MLRKVLTMLLFAAFSLSAKADLAASNDNVSITLHSGECKVPAVVAAVPANDLKMFHAASVVYDGRKIQACWVDFGDAIGIVDEDLDQGVIPKQAFKERGV